MGALGFLGKVSLFWGGNFLENKSTLLLISINFTLKTSHSCLK